MNETPDPSAVAASAEAPRSDASDELTNDSVSAGDRWLNRNVVGMGLTSFLSDASHEVATAILPLFMAAIGAPAAALGAIEGTADAVSSFAKLGAGYIGDRIGRRKPVIVAGYAVTAVGVGALALATSSVAIAVARAASWFGRGARGPLRDSIMAESVPPAAYGRAFGFERAGDSLGAVVGPTAALVLLALLGGGSPSVGTYRTIFVIAMLPGLLAALTFAVAVAEKRRSPRRDRTFIATVRALPPRFRLFLVGVGLFGAGDFAHTLLTLRAVELLTPGYGAARAGQIAIGLYVAHNVLYTALSYPVGALGDRTDKRKLLAAGYVVAAVMCFGLVADIASAWYLGALFALGGTYLAVEDTLERAIGADLLPADVRTTGFGVLATVNGVGDFLSSVLVGALWTTGGASWGFGYAAMLSVAGAVVVWFSKPRAAQ